VAGEAICRHILISAGVALDTVQRYMRPGQRELGLAVVELRRNPGRRVVAKRAVGAEVVIRVIRIGRGIVVALVAGETIRRRILISGRVALDAIQRNMRPGQRELSLTMIELRR